MDVLIEDYDYTLPDDRIAYYPLPQRDTSQLLLYKEGAIGRDMFYNLPNHLPAGATLVLNNSQVIEARLSFQKPSGGAIEIFCLEPLRSQKGNAVWLCMVGGLAKWKTDAVLEKEILVGNEQYLLQARRGEKTTEGQEIYFTWTGDADFFTLLPHAGEVPLPPYIKRKADEEDVKRYQTVFAQEKGSVAAPTAALHFTPEVFDALAQKGIQKTEITLHVGAGTFLPVKVAAVKDHNMHSERFTVTAAALQNLISSKEIIAVGTTSLRTLESLHWLGVKLLEGGADAFDNTLAQWEAYQLPQEKYSYAESLQSLIDYLQQRSEDALHCRTSLLIGPGYHFQSATAIITNFHQPKSTLILLIAAFIGEDWRKVYEYALQNDFRFLSYGDSSLLWRRKEMTVNR